MISTSFPTGLHIGLDSAASGAADLRALGEVQAAHDLNQDTLTRRRRVLGDDHPSTLASANSLAADLRARGRRMITPEAAGLQAR